MCCFFISIVSAWILSFYVRKYQLITWCLNERVCGWTNSVYRCSKWFNSWNTNFFMYWFCIMYSIVDNRYFGRRSQIRCRGRKCDISHFYTDIRKRLFGKKMNITGSLLFRDLLLDWFYNFLRNWWNISLVGWSTIVSRWSLSDAEPKRNKVTQWWFAPEQIILISKRH